MVSKSDSKRERERESHYKVRAKMQRLSEQAEMIHELRDQYLTYLDTPDPDSYKKIKEILKALNEVIIQNSQLIEEMQNDIAQMHDEWISH